MKVIPPSTIRIHPSLRYYDRPLEFHTHAILYGDLLKEGFKVLAKMKTEFGEPDLVVFKNDQPVAIVEVKQPQETKTEKTYDQCERYAGTGLPVILFWNLQYTDELISFLKDPNQEIKPAFRMVQKYPIEGGKYD